jgi:hypothetical protein
MCFVVSLHADLFTMATRENELGASLDDLIVHAANWFPGKLAPLSTGFRGLNTMFFSNFYLLFYLELDLTLDHVPPAGNNTVMTFHFGCLLQDEVELRSSTCTGETDTSCCVLCAGPIGRWKQLPPRSGAYLHAESRGQTSSNAPSNKKQQGHHTAANQ